MSDRVLVPVELVNRLREELEYGESTDWYSCGRDIIDSIEAAPEPVSGVPMPKNADEAELMAKAGLKWLEDNAAERLKPVSAEPFGYALGKVVYRAPDDCEEYLEFVELKDIGNDELAKYQKHGRAIALYTHPSAQQWIKCSERMPPIGLLVDLCVNGVVQNDVYWLDKSDNGDCDGEYFWDCKHPDPEERHAVDFDRDAWKLRPQSPE